MRKEEKEYGLTILLIESNKTKDGSNYHRFWQTFIELQKNISSKIKVENILIGSVSSNIENVANFVYQPKSHFIQKEINNNKFINKLSFESNKNINSLGHVNLCLKEEVINSLVEDSLILSNTVKLLNLLKEASDQVLIMPINKDYRTKNSSIPLTMDSGLPLNLIYLPSLT